MVTLFGTTTSPYVRKVRIHLLEMGVPFTMVNTADDEGQKALTAVTPLWKIPVVQWDGETILDSRVIVNLLWERHGATTSLRRLGHGLGRVEEENLITIIDGAVDAGINRFYFRRDGFEDKGYLVKQKDRIGSALSHVAGKLKGPSFTGSSTLGCAEISLLCAMDWLTFRQQFDVGSIPQLTAFMAAHANRESVKSTLPG